MRPAFAVRLARPDDPQVRSLLAIHLAGMQESSPPAAVFALDLTGLSAPEVTLWAVWASDGRIAAMGAMKILGEGHAEVKSMRTHPDFLRQGAAVLLLETIIDAARERKITRLSLETGRGEAFEPALALYRRHGFEPCEPFADYPPNDFSQFMRLELE